MTNNTKKDLFNMEGIVTEALPNRQFRVRLEGKEHVVLTYLGNKLKHTRIQLIIGDAVELEMSPYDLSRGRIINRLSK